MNALLFTLTLAVASDPNVWPSFLGAGASPVDPQTIPVTWSPTENIAWKTKLPGRGQSSPVIWGDRVFVTSIQGSMKDACHVTALSLGDGQIVWSQEIEATQKVRSNYFQSRSAPTPVVDREGVYAFFETGDVAAYSHEGKLVWQRTLTADYGEFESTLGLASSPLLAGDSLVILVDHEGPSYLVALDKRTGQTRWQTERTSRVSFSSPALVPVGDTQQIVVSSAGSIDGYDPATGKLLWSHDKIGGNRHATPLPIGPGRFLVAASPGMHGEREAEARKSNFAMQIEPTATGFAPKIVWSTEKAMPAFGSPVVHRGHAYWVNKVGVVFCFDAATGEPRYTHRIKQMCWATPIGIGDRLYIFGKDGVTSVLAAGPEFMLLAENSLWPGAADAPQRSDDGEHNHGGRPGGAVANSDSREPSTGKPEAKPAEIKPAEVKPAEAAPSATENAERSGGASGTSGRPSGRSGGRPAAGPGGLMFADPVQYGVAVVNGHLVIRTGEAVYCVRGK